MNKKELKNVIAHYCKFKDFETARNYARDFGEDIPSFDVEAEISKINELEVKENKAKMPEKGGK